MLVAYEGTAEGVADRVDAEKVVKLALEAAGGKRDGRQRRNGWMVGAETDLQLDAAIGRSRAEDVDDAKGPAVIMSGD
jgi:hypothetical protein